MARRRLRFAAFILVLCFSFPPSTANHSALLLPLTISPPSDSARILISDANFNRRQLQHSRRLLHKARTSLYDDLLTRGYYTTRIGLGTPPQEFQLIVDTGSTATYVPCSTCEHCGKHQDPKFKPNLSSTYKPVKCNPDCTCDATQSVCIYERQYAEMSSSTGLLVEDTVTFGNLSELNPQSVVFGCEIVETGEIYSQPADGLMGLGRHGLSIVDQLVKKGAINDSFSLCYGGMDHGGGAMILGEISTPTDMVFSKSNPERSPYYNVELKEIHIAGKKLPVPSKIFDEKRGTIVDSGTTYAYLPEPAFKAFKNAMMHELDSLQQVPGADPMYSDVCFVGHQSSSKELSETFPAIDLVFENGHKLSLSPENYLFKHAKVSGAYCLGVFQNGKDPTTILGGIIGRNILVTYDRQHSKVGFWKTNCSELWKRLNISDTSATTPPSSSDFSTIMIPPASAPNRPLGHLIPGEIEVGFITFEMSLSMKHSNLKPRLSELRDWIAKGLGVHSSQVHVLNSTSHGDGSLTSWAIYPEGSSVYFSNAAAMNIISHLSENDVQLPKTFGSYQLVKWNAQPAATKTWWEEHYLVIVMTIILILMLGLTIYGVWFVWRWRQLTLLQYQPVTAFGCEQELQPL